MTQAPARQAVRPTDTGPITITGVRTAWEPLAKQALVTALIVGAAVASTTFDLLEVSDARTMWSGVGVAVVLLVVTAAMTRSRRLTAFEVVVPMLDFLAIGLLRFGTGDARSAFLGITVLPLVWIAAGPGRWRIVLPLVGTAVPFLLPVVLESDRSVEVNELVRLLVIVIVYGAAATVVNELSRRSLLQLTAAQRSRRLAEAEVTQAALVQRSLQPVDGSGLPPAVRVAGTCVPARTVGGDFYDWYPTPDGGAAVTLGDVMGKGVGAGMIAAAVRAVIRSSLGDTDPAEAFRWTSAGLSTGSADMVSAQFTTCFHARISADGTLRWVDAGHGLTLLRRASGGSTFLRSGNLPLGVGTSWSSVEATLMPGDSVVCVSDGVLDLFGGDLDSLDRWQRFADDRPDIDALVAEVEALAERGDRQDDVTVVAVTWGGTPA